MSAADRITAVVPVRSGMETIGYTITCEKSEPITMYHEKDAVDVILFEDELVKSICVFRWVPIKTVNFLSLKLKPSLHCARRSMRNRFAIVAAE